MLFYTFLCCLPGTHSPARPFFSYAEPKTAAGFSQCQIGPVGIGNQPCSLQLQPIFFIHTGFIHAYAYNLSHKHDMTPQFLNFRYPALNVNGAFLNNRRQGQVLGFSRRKSRLMKLVHIPAGTYAAVICGMGQLFCGQINNKLSCFPKYITGIPPGPHGNKHHSRVGTDCPDPGYCDNIWFFSFPGTAYHNCRKGIEHISCSPVSFLFSHLRNVLSIPSAESCRQGQESAASFVTPDLSVRRYRCHPAAGRLLSPDYPHSVHNRAAPSIPE